MKTYGKIILAEAIKQHKNYFLNKSIYVSLFLWPVLTFITAYYNYLPFQLDQTKIAYLNKDNLIVFLLLGYMCMSFFRSLVQSAWRYSYERQAGTLEYLYLSPANRFCLLLGNALSSVVEGVFCMVIFSGAIVITKVTVLNAHMEVCMVLFVLLTLTAVLWGTFLNAMFMYSRDTDFLFTILEEPMEIFSGVKVPAFLFPFWAKLISFLFPLTYLVEAIRKAVLSQAGFYELRYFFLINFGINVLLFTATLLTIKMVEDHMRKTGSVVLF